MQIDRRQLIKLGSAGAATAAVATVASGEGASKVQAKDKPIRHDWTNRAISEMPEPDHAAMLLNRASFGGRPGDLARVQAMGVEAWVDEQLDYESIDDSEVESVLASQVPSLAMTGPQLMSEYADGPTRNAVRDGLRMATIYRQLFSPKQLYEVMVDFWTDHFNIDQNAVFNRVLKTADDRDVIRKHALGNFKELLTASAHSPSMLTYLDNDNNRKGNPNENYARELMELHTVGAAVDDYPYSEEDVKQVARCFTGWTWDNGRRNANKAGTFVYNNGTHDDGVKTVMSNVIPAGLGKGDGQQVIDILCLHPAVGQYIASKLVRRFVTDDPMGLVPDLVEEVRRTYYDSNGDIKSMLRTILLSDTFAGSFSAYGGRFSRPLDHIVRALRTTGLTQDDLGTNFRSDKFSGFYRIVVRQYLTSMGMVPFTWETPDGFADYKDPWASAGILLNRWNFGIAMVEGRVVNGFKPQERRPEDVKTSGEIVDFWCMQLSGRLMQDEDRDYLIDYLSVGDGENGAPGTGREEEVMGLLLDSPYFMWR